MKLSIGSWFKIVLMLIVLGAMPGGCSRFGWREQGGANDSLVVDMPFVTDYKARCTQGVNGAESHRGNSTYYDLDFDTPNDKDDLVLAPIAGKAYVHDDPNNGFGRHVNVAVGDGTYIILGHLSRIFVTDGADVGPGTILGFEGSTGHSTGDHVHMGRHLGDAAQSGEKGKSVPGLMLRVYDSNSQSDVVLKNTDFVCGLSNGRFYQSSLREVESHPDGTLIQSPYSPDIFVLEEARKELFEDEDVFWGENHNFSEVVLVTPAEIACYRSGSTHYEAAPIRAVYDGRDVWLLKGRENSAFRERRLVPPAAWQEMLASWGITPATKDELPHDAAALALRDLYPRNGAAGWRDGALVREKSRSDVFTMASNLAVPIESWEVLARLGLSTHTIFTVPDGQIAATTQQVGSCTSGTLCLTEEFSSSCGNSLLGAELHNVSPADDTASDIGGPKDSGQVAVDTDLPGTGSGSGSGSGSSGGGGSGTTPTVDTLNLTWQTPGSVPASRITLSGVYAPGGVEGWWANYASVNGMSSVSVAMPSMTRGDYFRFSVEYVIGPSTTWSCLGPFPPGRVQGVATATWHGQSLPVAATADPSSAGCGLIVRIP